MENIELRLKRVGCQRVTDNFFEGEGQDEVHYEVSTGAAASFVKLKEGGEFKVHEGQTLEKDEHIYTLDWKWPGYRVKFWETDTLSNDDILGSFTLGPAPDGKLVIRAESDTTWDGEKFHFMGARAKYWVWISMLTPSGAPADVRVIQHSSNRSSAKPREGGRVEFPK